MVRLCGIYDAQANSLSLAPTNNKHRIKSERKLMVSVDSGIHSNQIDEEWPKHVLESKKSALIQLDNHHEIQHNPIVPILLPKNAVQNEAT